MEEKKNKKPKFECNLCEETSNPETKSEKRSIAMHITNKHKVDSENVDKYYSKIEERTSSESPETSKTTKKSPLQKETTQKKDQVEETSSRTLSHKVSEKKDGKWVYIVQAKFNTEYEASSERRTLIEYDQNLEEFSYQRENYVFVRCSTRNKAENMKQTVENICDALQVTIEEEFVEKGEGILDKVKEKIPLLFKEEKTSKRQSRHEKQPQQRKPQTPQTRRPEQRQQKTPSKKEKSPEQTQTQIGQEETETREQPQTQTSPTDPKQFDDSNPSAGKQIAGYTVSADQFKHFIETEADPTDMESLMMTRQQIAKGESMGGTDPRKWAGAIAIVLIILAVVYIMISGGGGGGGGGVSLPGVGSIP